MTDIDDDRKMPAVDRKMPAKMPAMLKDYPDDDSAATVPYLSPTSETVQTDDTKNQEEKKQGTVTAKVTPTKIAKKADTDEEEEKEAGKNDDAKASDTEEDDSEKPVAKKGKTKKAPNADDDGPTKKKLRVKPEKVKEVRDKMLQIMVEFHAMGMKSVDLPDLSSKLGYKNHRSDAIAEAVSLLKQESLVTKSKLELLLTPKAIEEHVPKEPVAENAEQVMEMFWERFEKKLASQDKTKGAKAQEAAKLIWDLLADGKDHSKQAMLAVTDYKGTNSSGFEGIMKAFNELNFLEKVGKNFRFADKLFPFGRP